MNSNKESSICSINQSSNKRIRETDSSCSSSVVKKGALAKDQLKARNEELEDISYDSNKSDQDSSEEEEEKLPTKRRSRPSARLVAGEDIDSSHLTTTNIPSLASTSLPQSSLSTTSSPSSKSSTDLSRRSVSVSSNSKSSTPGPTYSRKIWSEEEISAVKKYMNESIGEMNWVKFLKDHPWVKRSRLQLSHKASDLKFTAFRSARAQEREEYTASRRAESNSISSTHITAKANVKTSVSWSTTELAVLLAVTALQLFASPLVNWNIVANAVGHDKDATRCQNAWCAVRTREIEKRAGANGSTPAVTTESPQVHLSTSLVAPAPTPTSISPTSTTSSPSIYQHCLLSTK